MLLERVTALKPENVEVLFRIAETYVELNEYDLAFHWLGQIVNRGHRLSRLLTNPTFSDIISDERFQRLLEISDRDSTDTTE
jgi:hypothetical protein